MPAIDLGASWKLEGKRLRQAPALKAMLAFPSLLLPSARYPIMLDAMASEMQRKGDAMMSKWAEIMTNMRPKTYFLQPHVAIPLGIAIVREFVEQKVFGKPDRCELLRCAAMRCAVALHSCIACFRVMRTGCWRGVAGAIWLVLI